MSRPQRETLFYILATYLLSTSLGFFFPLLGIELSPIARSVLYVGYMFIPGGVAMAFERGAGRSIAELALRLRPNRYWLLAWLGPVVLVALMVTLSVLMPGTVWSPGKEALIERLAPLMTPEQILEMRNQLDRLPVHPVMLLVPQALVAGATVNALAAFGEELGWRGYLWNRLAGLGFWKANLVIGILWGVWHAPLILQGHNYPHHPVAGVAMMVLACIALSPLFAWARVRGKSVIAAAIAHGTFNAFAGITVMVLAGGNELWVGAVGLSGILAAAVLGVVIAVFDRGVGQASFVTSRQEP